MPRGRLRILFATALFAVVGASVGVPPANSQKLPLKTYTTADGLATSVIHHSFRDSDGFLWFSGRGGMSRFDGTSFVSFKLEDQSAPLVHQVLESRDRKRFWIATDNGLYRVDRTEGTSTEPLGEKLTEHVRKLNAKKISPRAFWALFENPDGTLLGGGDNILESGDANGDAVEFNRVALREGVGGRLRIRDIIGDDQGSAWVATDQGILRRLPDRRWIMYTIPKVYGIGNESGRMAFDRSGNLWIPVRTGVFVLRPEPLEALAGLPHLHEISAPTTEFQLRSYGSFELPRSPGGMVRLVPALTIEASGAGSAIAVSPQSISMASDGKIWFATRDRVYIIDGETYDSLRDATMRPGVGAGLTEDLGGNMWFATSNGILKLVNRGLTSYDQTSGLTEPNVHTIHEMPNGNLLVSHGTWRVSELTPAGFETARLNLPTNARIAWTHFPVVADSRGSLWILENFGLYSFEHRTRLADQAALTPIKHDARSPYRAFNDKHGRLWISGNNEPGQLPLKSYDPATGEWIDYSTLEGFPKQRAIASFAEDSRGRIWLGLYGGSVVLLENGRFTTITSDQGIPKGSIFGLVIDRKGRLWIGSSEDGIARVDDPFAERLEFTRITENEGLSSNNVRCLVEDNDGNIYAGTVRGVSRIDGETDNIQVFTTADGLAADFVVAAYRDRSGVMWFGTSNGLSRYQPTAQVAHPAREVFISSLQVAGTYYKVSEFGQRAIEGLDLSSGENNIRVSFTSIGEAAEFQYKIQGAIEQDWTEGSSERTLNFANLSPGDYKLLVRAAGASAMEPASVAFTIRPPFWRSWWFLTIAAVFVAGSVVALDRYRVSKTRQVQNALAKSVESETRFRTLAETASDAIITIDEDSTILYVNEAAERVFGYSPDEIVGKRLTMLMPERMRSGHEAGLARYIRSAKKNIEWNGVSLPGLRKDGSEVPLELSFGEFERNGKRYFTGIARDITERLRAEEEIRRAREDRMRELQKVRSRIATDLHDDIGSSLTQIAVLSEVARGQASTLNADNVATPLERIKNVSKELVAVMSDIVWAINPQKDHLNDLVQRMRRFGSDLLSGRGIAFEFNAPDMSESTELGANIRREVFAIYKESINNAVKYSECSKVVTDFSVSDDSLVLKISDDGKGFDTGVVLSEDFRPDIGGNGLVSIRRRATELGGICDIQSGGGGTAIIVSVPLGHHENGRAE